ncbi:winged helix-turn-helix domain-containing protein [Sinomonas notoginsengisoli]|uniref:winged helix-turn-helix domain-containing protein n=1 Tax=Sinomonas notoginsengisoli TaxID=1457311 RepID=UPI001F209EB5|nr:crosslink repair DNA glycosylase YcaQ family protein [Sinomonas notoginsengisoli]
MTARLTLAQARRLALAAQGLHRPRPSAPATARSLVKVFENLHVVQIDSVNVLVRSHYLPFFSRLGPYDRAGLDRLSSRSPRRMLEYWAHEASFIEPQHFDALRLWQHRKWAGAHSMDPEVRGALAERILSVLASSRPLTAAQLTQRLGHVEERRSDQWGWNWNAVQRVVSHLFELGAVAAAGRSPAFERRYALTQHVLPRGLARDGTEDRAEAILELTRRAVEAHGIGTARCFADYFRLPVRATEEALSRLAAEGAVEPVVADGWDARLFMGTGRAIPRAATGRALLSPFDSLVFERRRLERLFRFHYRIEIYTPAQRREYGYYVLPFLLRDAMVARVDLKADRAAGALLVQAAHGEPDAPSDTAVELAAELRLLADWLTLDDVRVAERGNLASALARAVADGARLGNRQASPRVSPVD